MPQSKAGFTFKETLEGLDAIKPVVGDLNAVASATGLRLSGKVQTLLKLNCDRCLRPYFLNLVVDIDERFVVHDLHDPDTQKERELTSGDFFEALPPDGVLDISDVVYQAVTLATPTARLCGDQCPGPPMPDTASKSASLSRGKKEDRGRKEIDPRWKNLKSLFPNEDTESKS